MDDGKSGTLTLRILTWFCPQGGKAIPLTATRKELAQDLGESDASIARACNALCKAGFLYQVSKKPVYAYGIGPAAFGLAQAAIAGLELEGERAVNSLGGALKQLGRLSTGLLSVMQQFEQLNSNAHLRIAPTQESA